MGSKQIDKNHNMGILDLFDAFKPDRYVCNLSNEAQDLAKQELREDDQCRNQALTSLRNWIKLQPHIHKCRLDSNFLLRFLRVKKYSVPLTQEVLERYLSARTYYPQWYHKLDIQDPLIEELVDKGFVFPLKERDQEGRCVIFSVGNAIDPSRHDNSATMRAMVMTFEALLEDEENQVRGFTYVFEQKGCGLSHLAIWTPTEFQRAFTSAEKALPMRHKEVHFVNMPYVINAAFEFFKSFLSDKIKKRLMLHYGVDSLYQEIPRNILPKEYGGKIPMRDMIDSWKKELEQRREGLLRLDEMKVDEKWKATKCRDQCKSGVMGCEGSFRKLEID